MVPSSVCMSSDWPNLDLILICPRSLQNCSCFIRSSGLFMPSAFIEAVGMYFTCISSFWTHSRSQTYLVPTCLFGASYGFLLRFTSAAWLLLLRRNQGTVFSVLVVTLVMFSTTSFSRWLSSRACWAAYATALNSASVVDLLFVDSFFDFHLIRPLYRS